MKISNQIIKYFLGEKCVIFLCHINHVNFTVNILNKILSNAEVMESKTNIVWESVITKNTAITAMLINSRNDHI